MALVLCLAASILAHPLHLGADPPELRSVRNVLIRFESEASPGVARTREEALALATRLGARARAGEDFASLAADRSEAWNARTGAVLGSFPPGVLDPAFDAFLFGAEVGDVSEPLVTEVGVHVLERVETYAAARHLLIPGRGDEARARADALLERYREGESFAELAAAHSADSETAARGGALAIYERGARDRLVKRLAFELSVGDVGGPIEGPLGLHLVQRVAPDELDASLRERTFVRARAILVSWAGALGAPDGTVRDQQTARLLAAAAHERISAGADFGEVASELNDDPGGRERRGDLGWLHRRDPGQAPALARAFLMRPGALCEGPITTPAGYLILLRER